MPIAEYSAHDAVALAAMVRHGEVGALELVDAAIAVIERHNPRLNAVVQRGFEMARAAAKALDPTGPLAGVPFLAKDTNVDVAGFRTTHGSRYFADSPVREDDELPRRWRQAGLIILGKTNTPELAGDFVTEPTLWGPTRNPWSLDHTPGGSSGGAAAAVASGMVPMAHGTDSGGSIRVPAACCGVVGLKPSRGRVPEGPSQGVMIGGLNCEHGLTRSVRDSAALLDATSAPEPGAHYQAPPPARPFLEEVDRPTGRLKIAVMTKTAGDDDIHPDCVAAAEQTAGLLRELGHEAFPYAFSRKFDQLDLTAPHWMSVMAVAVEQRAREIGRPPRPDELEAITWKAWQDGRAMSLMSYLDMRRQGEAASRAIASEFRNFDLLLTPGIGQPPARIGELDSRTHGFDFESYARRAYAFCPFTELFNLTGQPAISLPLHWNADGLPIGVQFVARYGEEALLFRLASALEEARPWRDRHPPLWG